MFDYRETEEYVRDYCGEFADDYDIDGIVCEIRDKVDESADELSDDEFTEIVQRHDCSAN